MSGPCGCNGKKVQWSIFHRACQTHSRPPQSTQELHFLAARFHGRCGIDYDQISKPQVCGRVVSIEEFISLSLFQNAIKARDIKYGVSLKVGATITPERPYIYVIASLLGRLGCLC